MLAYAANAKGFGIARWRGKLARGRVWSEGARLRLVSLAHLTVLDADPLALIDAAAAGGFDAVGLRIRPAMAARELTVGGGAPGPQRRIRQRLVETGLKILDVEAIWLRPETRIEALKPALGTGAELGAKYVLTIAL